MALSKGETAARQKPLRHRLLAGALATLLACTLLPMSALAEPDAHAGVLDRALEFHIDTSERDRRAFEQADGNPLQLGLDSSYANYDREQSNDINLLSALPSTYDLRDVGGVSYDTPVKHQNPWGACWAFGGIAAIESNLIKQGVAVADGIDLSELHLAWFSYQAMTAADAAHSSSPQVGEGAIALGETLDSGGRSRMVAATIASNQGLTTEAEVPYRNADGALDEYCDSKGNFVSHYSRGGDWSVDPAKRFDSMGYQLDEACILPSPAAWDEAAGEQPRYRFDAAAADVLKSTIMHNGAVNISYAADQSRPDEEGNSEYFNYTTWSQYTDRQVPINHSVTLVGWDDTYAVTNFKGDKQPPEPGAWIVKNSWGSKNGGTGNTSTWGIDGEGYFYLSYFDQSISDPSVFIMAVSAGKQYDATYQYDMKGHDSAFASPTMFGDEFSVANVFTIEQDQVLKAVSAITYTPDSKLELDVCKLDAEGVAPSEGELLEHRALTVDYAGYHRIELSQDYPVRAGERIAIIETVSDDSDSAETTWFAPIEVGISKSAAQQYGLSSYSVAMSNPGESFYRMGSEWAEIDELNREPGLTDNGAKSFGNANIKLFANAWDAPALPSLTLAGAENTTSSLSSLDAAATAVTGVIAANPDRVRLVLADVPSGSPAHEAFAAVPSGPGKAERVTFDLALLRSSLVAGPLEVTLPASYAPEGSEVRVFHYIEAGKLDSAGQKADVAKVDVYDGLAVRNGTVTITVCSLSPLSVSYRPSSPGLAPSPVPNPSGTETAELAKAGDGTALFCLVFAGAAVVSLFVLLSAVAAGCKKST